MRGRLLRQMRTADAPFFYGSPYFPEGRKEVLWRRLSPFQLNWGKNK